MSLDFSRLRIGQGYDSHALVEGIPFFIGGVQVESQFGAKGHSDGDCLLHALTDSLLGALAQGDIGQWFPDNDEQYKGISSRLLLERVLGSDRLPKFSICNVDITLFLDRPKIAPHSKAISRNLLNLLSLQEGQLNLKAKTWEGLSGKKDLIAASVTTLLVLD